MSVHCIFVSATSLVVGLLFQCCFTSTETIQTIRDGSQGSTSSFTQLLVSVGQFLFFSVVLRPQRPYRLLGTEPRVHLLFHTAPGLCRPVFIFQCCFTSTDTTRTIRDGLPRTSPRHSHSSCVSCALLHRLVQCCFTSTVTAGTIRDREPRSTPLLHSP